MTAPLPCFTEDWALFLDIDGTLLDIAARPQDVVVPAELPARLQALAARLSGALALVSGRTLADIDRLFAPLRFAAAGQHGLERRAADGAIHRLTSDPGRLAGARSTLIDFAAAWPGTMVEDKGDSLALHFRNAPQAAADAMALATRLADAAGPDFRLLYGKSVIELQPASADKGRAIDRFLAEAPFAGRRPVFFGDDVTDESGFAAVNAAGGESIRILGGNTGRLAPTAARHAMPEPADLRAWLVRLAG